MPSVLVRFEYRPGLRSTPFRQVRLGGAWDGAGSPSAEWMFVAMSEDTDAGGRNFWSAQVSFAETSIGQEFRWGVRVDGPAGDDVWGVAAEVEDQNSTERTRSFVLAAGQTTQAYHLTWGGRLGANRWGAPGQPAQTRFGAWAPNARAVSLVLADPAIGYVADDGTGAVAKIAMSRDADGLWMSAAGEDARLSFDRMVGTPYMFEVVKDDGATALRSDMWSLMQIGAGEIDPGGGRYAGPAIALDGPKSCSVVCDPGVVVTASGAALSAADFWSDEFDPGKPLPRRVEDLVIYELHVGALGFGRDAVGTLDDAIRFLDHLERLGINAVELLPVAEFENIASWGYGTSHFFATDQAAGGTDKLKAFVKQAHRRGIAVLLDVCYNHFDPSGERAEWAYDSNDPGRNIYFWYEGRPGDYPHPDGGYIDNISTGWAPGYAQEAVRQLFISSAVFLVEVCHVDGFRLDQTSSIHEYAALHADGRHAGRAAAFGLKFLKQWTRTMRLVAPHLFLFAEDYSDWPPMTEPSLLGSGVGFDATWYGDFHHNLVEFDGGAQAQLLKNAGYGDDRPLAMTAFAGALTASAGAKVVYVASHDDAGNRRGSARTIVTATNAAPLVGPTRQWGGARLRFAAAMTLLSAGTPMFFMGEEAGAAKPYRYDDFAANREDIAGMASGSGAGLFACYRDLLLLRAGHGAFRSRNIAIATVHDANRVIAFHRWDGKDEFLVVGSLANSPFASGYWLAGGRVGGGAWREVFNSDSSAYGGWNVGNGHATVSPAGDAVNIVLPAAGVVVFARLPSAG